MGQKVYCCDIPRRSGMGNNGKSALYEGLDKVMAFMANG